MEAILTAYRILFNVQFTLVGYDGDLRSFIRVIPDEQTKALHNEYAMLLRTQKNSFTVLMEVEPQGADENKPMFLPTDGEVFRYYVKFSNSMFITFTNLSAYDFGNDILVLNNEASHKVGAEILLSKSVGGYSSAATYKKGYLVESGGNVYKALKESNSGDVHGVGETTYWKSISLGDTFVSQADLQNRSALLPTVVDRDAIMLIEIKHKASLATDYQLLDASQKCKEVNYKVKFQNMN